MMNLYLERYGNYRQPEMPSWMKEERYMYCEHMMPVAKASLSSMIKKFLTLFS